MKSGAEVNSVTAALNRAGEPAGRRTRGIWRELVRSRTLFLMVMPLVLFFLIFAYVPMVGIYYAFTRFDFNGGLFNSPFVGFKNFEFLWKSGVLWNITKNTVLFNIVFILSGNFSQIIAAILLSQLPGKWFRKITQSVMFLPWFVSFVLVGIFMYAMLNYETGALNALLKSWGWEPFDAYNSPWVWKYILFFTNLWKWLGWGSVIYLAAIMGISKDYYEAAEIDGANVFRQIRYITLPLLKPTFVVMLLLALGGIMRGQFDMFYQLIGNNGILFNATDIIDTYVYRSLKVNFDIGIGTAAGLYQSFFGFVLIVTVNAIIKKSQRRLCALLRRRVH